MTNDELLVELRAIETSLRSAEVQNFFKNQPDDVRARFVSLREEISVMINRLSNAQLSDIAKNLAELSGELKAGIDSLKARIEKLDNAIAILDTVSNVLGIVGRVLAFMP